MKTRSALLILLFFVFSLLQLSPLYAALPETFRTRLTVDLCPEYRFGNVTLSVKYTIGSGVDLYDPVIESEQVNQADNTASIVLKLPASYGTTPINVLAYCTNGYGTGDASNSLSVSNCDALEIVDTDGDGIPNRFEDTDCSNYFSPGDASNPDNVDTDGDGVRDLVETLNGFSPTNPGSSPRPYVFAGGPFDPDGDGNSNAVVWRPSLGTWYIKDVGGPGQHVALQWGLPGDVPFVYDSPGYTSDVGIVRDLGGPLEWYFHGPGFELLNGQRQTAISFGIFGDNIIPGPWEEAGLTQPAVARLFDGRWYFFVYQRDGSMKALVWGGNGDIPKPQDHDGDGIFDLAVFRPSEGKTYLIQSSDGLVRILNFGTGTADHTVRGDITGDGIDDITFWEPTTGVFTSLTSDHGFDDEAALDKDPNHYFEMQLGLYFVHLPLSWNMQDGKVLLTVVDHAAGLRYIRRNNKPSAPPQTEQWGLPGDSVG